MNWKPQPTKLCEGFVACFYRQGGGKEEGEAESDSLERKQKNYDKCMMSQVLSEIGLAFSAEEDIMLLDKANKFVLNLFLTVFGSLAGAYAMLILQKSCLLMS